jgi:inner membrane protein
MRWREHRDDRAAWTAVKHLPAAQQLDWFNHGFMKTERRDGQVVLTDLRMGAEPDYTFRFAVARWDGVGEAVAITPAQKEWPWEAARGLATLWDRIWTEPAPLAGAPDSDGQAATAVGANDGATPATSASK